MNKKKPAGPAGRHFHYEDYQSSDETAQGLAITHEQASDTYTEGTIDGRIDELDAASEDFPKQ
ncbi:YozQ family protein [Bacillus thermotolerans]|uniref:DUF4025 domain-containing protein n=1 Tax=Bacillus thermotolerans TaxID=1221996 RepID=A0A0F5HSR9_BACTR|nr:YozQ family protein [Bacillus thermotolerans]KKB33405.1 hypothetical protein QY97_03333 [Bacillus thermotolerans]KKB36351.1 hypothetical protein QY95_03215 [Bacillus thermotolerans]